MKRKAVQLEFTGSTTYRSDQFNHEEYFFMFVHVEQKRNLGSSISISSLCMFLEAVQVRPPKQFRYISQNSLGVLMRKTRKYTV
jgi:hypothetical protein